MKRLFLFILLLLTLQTEGLALENFYLKKAVVAEKLLPETLSANLTVGDSRTLTVDVLPRGASCRIVWEIDSPIATVTQNGNQCTLRATSPGTAILTASGDGLSCEIKVLVSKKAPTIRLDTDSSSIKLGESATISAHPSVDGCVSWHVSGASVGISHGGNLCKIKPKEEGLVKISASLDGTTVSKTLEILPSDAPSFSLYHLGFIFSFSGVIILIILLLNGGVYERKS